MAWSMMEKKKLSGSKFREVWKWSETSMTEDGETDALIISNCDNIVIQINTTNEGGDSDESIDFSLYARVSSDASFANTKKSYTFDNTGGSEIERLETDYESIKIEWTVAGTTPEFSFDIYIAKVEKAGR